MPPDHQTAMMLGELRAQVTALTLALKDQTEKAEARAAKIAAMFEEFKIEQLDINDEMRHMKIRLDKADPVLSLMTRWEERIRGMVILLVLIGGILGGAATVFWSWVKTKIGV
jgi:hypothetical protein